MKFAVSSGLKTAPMKRRLQLEGNEIVEVREAEFLVTNQVTEWAGPRLQLGERFPDPVISLLGYTKNETERSLYLTRWFDHRGWSGQVFLGIPLTGSANGNQGKQVASGVCGTYVRSERARLVFEKPGLETLLKESRYSGFVSLEFGDEGETICGIELGVPGWDLYAILEGVPGSLGEWIGSREKDKLLESWVAGVVVTRCPYPVVLETREAVEVRGLNDEIEKHFWLGEHSRFKNAVFTKSTVIGVATAWSRSPSDAVARATNTCKNLLVPEIQFRTDLWEQSKEVWEKARQVWELL